MTKILNQLEVMDRRPVDKNSTVATLADCADIPNGQVVFVVADGKFYISNQTAQPTPVYGLATNLADGLMWKEDKATFDRLSVNISNHTHSPATSQTAGFVKLDTAITDGGQNPVTGGAIYSALLGKAAANHDHVVNVGSNRYNTLADAINSRALADHTHQDLTTILNAVNGTFDTINHPYTGILTNLLAGRLSVAALDGRYAIKTASGSITTSASDVSFERSGEATMSVQQALEQLMFVPLAISSFSINPSTTTKKPNYQLVRLFLFPLLFPFFYYCAYCGVFGMCVHFKMVLFCATAVQQSKNRCTPIRSHIMGAMDFTHIPNILA